MGEKKIKKVKKGKNCIFWSFSDKKQFFPYCHNSIFGFHEKRSSHLLKNYISKGITLFNSDFYNSVDIIKNYQSKIDPSRIFSFIYSNRLIRAFTTYSQDLGQYENPKFFSFYFDNYGYFYINLIISFFQIKGKQIYLFCSNEKKSLLNLLEDKNKVLDDEFDIINLQLQIKENQNKFRNNIFYFESYPYWLNKSQISQIENFYEENKEEIESFYKKLQVLYDFYSNKFYSNSPVDAKIIVEKYLRIQKTWIYLISLIKSNDNLIILDGSFCDFKFFPLLAGYLPQNESDKQIFDIYLFGDNLNFGMGKNILILNDTAKLKSMKYDIKSLLSDKVQPFFNPFCFEILSTNLRRCLAQNHYSILLRYLYLIQSRKDCDVYGPYIYVNKNKIKNVKLKDSKDYNFAYEKPFTLPLKLPDELFYFILRLLPDKNLNKTLYNDANKNTNKDTNKDINKN